MSQRRIRLIATFLLLGAGAAPCRRAAAQGAPGTAGTEPPAQPEAERPQPTTEKEWLELGVSLYESANFDDCSRTFSELLSPATPHRLEDAENVRTARYYYVSCLLGQGKTDLADAQIREAVKAGPQLTPDPDVFPRSMVERYDRVRTTMIEELEKEQREQIKREEEERKQRAADAERRKESIQQLTALASQETVIQRNSRWMAAVPFGVGQFQNRDEALGWVFLTTETLLLGTWLGAVTWELALSSKADDPRADKKVLSRRLDRARTMNSVTGWSLLGVAAVGVVEAQLSFEPEFRRVRPRALPPELLELGEARTEPRAPRRADLRLAPSVTPLRRGGQLGITGAF